ncbi:MAG: response regulator [Desulfarculaceae bacterium]
MKLMLVDDEERFLQTTNKLLAKKGYEAVTATSGAEALDKLEVSIIDVVILDVKMPGMDGVETLKQIKSRFPLVEVIMLTGHGTINSAVDGMKTGAFDYLTKPCDLDELLAKALDAHENKKKMEEKIRMAQTRTYMKSPREILKSDDKNE